MPTVVAVQPSSLVFVAVVAIWAAWFVPHWIRRREHLSTAASVDRFSEAMRVLDREDPVPLRVRRQQVATVGASPLHARTATLTREAGMPSRPGPAPTRTGAGPRIAASTRPPRPQRSRESALGRRIRGLVLVGALLAVPVLAVLAVLELAPWWSLGLALAVVALSVFTLRLAAVREQTARRTAYAMRTRAPQPAPESGGQVADAAVAQPAAAVREQPTVTAYRAGDATWSPVPVPRPTYALKDPAPRREPRPTQPEPVPEVAPDAAAPTVRPDRRVVGG